MKKQGFTLIELIVSIVLVGIILASMIGTLMSLKETYSVINDDVEARTYSALVSKTINDHIMKNNGIKGYECLGNTCELILGSFNENGSSKVMTLEIATSTIKTSPMKETGSNTEIGSLIEKATTVKYYGEGYAYYKTIKHYDRHYYESNKDVQSGYRFVNINQSSHIYEGKTASDLKDYLVNITIVMNDPKFNIEIYSTSEVDEIQKLRLFELTYNSNGGTTCPNPSKIGSDRQPWGELCRPTRENYGFTGWYLQQDGISIREVTASSLALENITVYAHWDNNRYSCPAGQYLPAGSKTCKPCTENSYCPGIADQLFNKYEDQGRVACASGYSSPIGSTSVAACKITCAENTHVRFANDSYCTSCGSGYRSGSHVVAQGSTSSCTIVDPCKPNVTGGGEKIYGSTDTVLTCGMDSSCDSNYIPEEHTCPAGGNYNSANGKCEYTATATTTYCKKGAKLSGYSGTCYCCDTGSAHSCQNYNASSTTSSKCSKWGSSHGVSCSEGTMPATYKCTYPSSLTDTKKSGSTCYGTISGDTCPTDWSVNTSKGTNGHVYSCNGDHILSGSTCSYAPTVNTAPNLYYSFGYSTTENGTVGNWSADQTSNTKTISKTEYVGTRYYSCRVYASGSQTSNVVNSDTKTLLRIKNAKLTFNANGGTISGTNPVYVRSGGTSVYNGEVSSTTVTLPTAAKTGSEWSGWYTAASGGNQILNSSNAIQSSSVSGYINNNKWATTENKTLFAHYSAKQYTVTYNCNGGSGAPTSQTVEYMASFTLTNAKCTTAKSGYTQDGWNTKADGSGTDWTTANTTNWTWNIDDNVTLYAKWVACGPGTYQNGTSCSNCPAGKYSSNTINTTCYDCTAGYYCGGGSTSPTQFQCLGRNSYSAAGAGSCSTPTSGYYTTGCDESGNSCTGQTICPAGSKCSNGVQTECVKSTSSVAGTYQPSTGKSTCTTASNGYYTDKKGATSQLACPPGSYCSGGKINPCPAGTYSSTSGASSSSACQNCTAGYYCDPGSTTPTQHKCLGRNLYSAAGASSCSAVPQGSVSIGCDENGNGCTGQTQCQAGTACSGGVQVNCVKSTDTVSGTYSASAGATTCTTASNGKYVQTDNATSQSTCPAGSYCPSGKIIACPAGTYNASTGSSSSSACQNCTAGYYCTAGSTSATQNPCVGRTKYSTAGASSCSTVSNGYYTTGCNASGNTCTGQSQCTAGTACSNGTQSNCVASTATVAGTYSASAGATTCTTASNGYYTTAANASSQTACTKGHYCPGGKIIACPAGTYNASTGKSASSDCQNCTAGYYCGVGSSSATQNMCVGRTKYSAAGATECKTVSDGYYTTGCNASGNACTGQQKCATGAYCADGVETGCVKSTATVAGTYQASSGATSCTTASNGNYVATDNATSQTTCPKGYYCTGGKIIACPAGTYNDTTGATSSSACKNCTAGYYCDAGSTTPTQHECTGRTKYSGAGASSCSSVSSGYYTTGCNASGNVCTGQSQCTPGTYCSGGVKNNCVASSATVAGNYSSSSGATSCTTATDGNYVSTSAATSQTTCPAGSYCAGGKITPCPAGTYNASTGKSASSACANCTAGYYCNAGSTSATQHECTGRTKYSAAGASSCSSVSSGYYTTGCNASGNVCTGQSQCTAGTACSNGVQSNCVASSSTQAGTYSASNGATSCTTASNGYYTTGNKATSQTTCPKGYWCSGGKITPCAAGTYNGSTGQSASSACANCTAGYYCTSASGTATQYECTGRTSYSKAGATACSTVSTGYYTTGCDASGNHCTNQSQCTAGTACSGGVQSNCVKSTSSVVGTYSASNGATSCTSATSGNYTDVAKATQQKTCPAGYYCSGGKITACSAGSANGSTGQTASSACAACVKSTSSVAGTYAANAGSSSCTTATSGNYTTAANATSQTTCPKGYWCASGKITACSAGSANGSTGQSASSACAACVKSTSSVAGTYAANAGSSSCTTASDGYYTSSANATAQAACTTGHACSGGKITDCVKSTDSVAGTYQGSTGKTSCTTASNGYYTSTAAATSQTICPAGYWCASGKITACAKGTANGSTGQSASSACAACVKSTSTVAGTYAANTGSSSCTTASAGYYTTQANATSQTACTTGHYCSGGKIIECTKSTSSVAGTYQGSTGKSSCTTASDGYYTTAAGATGQTICPKGSWCAGGKITACPSGQTTSGTGKTKSTDCYSPNTFVFSYTGNFRVNSDSTVRTGSYTFTTTTWKVYFLTTGNLTISTLTSAMDIFVVGGGGAGGANGRSAGITNYCAGGGGGGGYTSTCSNKTPSGTITVTIGDGGVGCAYNASTCPLPNGGDGEASSFGNICSADGGKGGEFGGKRSTSSDNRIAGYGGAGGSGGGGGGYNGGTYQQGATGGGSYGSNGVPKNTANCYNSDCSHAGNPGSGQGSTTCEFGLGTTSGCNSGVAGYAGGGGGGAGARSDKCATIIGPAGAVGGGAGTTCETAGVDGTPNTGGGGGGAGARIGGNTQYRKGGDGGSGIVVIKNH